MRTKEIVKTIFKNLRFILNGLRYYIFKDSYVESVAKEREVICNSCEHKGNECLVPKTGPCCNICGCSLKLKLRSLETSCPENKWTNKIKE